MVSPSEACVGAKGLYGPVAGGTASSGAMLEGKLWGASITSRCKDTARRRVLLLRSIFVRTWCPKRLEKRIIALISYYGAASLGCCRTDAYRCGHLFAKLRVRDPERF